MICPYDDQDAAQRIASQRFAISGFDGERPMSRNHKTILVVEDETDLSDLITYNLQRNGYEVIAAPDGAKALQLIATRLPIWCCSISCCQGWTAWKSRAAQERCADQAHSDSDPHRQGRRDGRGCRADHRRGRLRHQAVQHEDSAGAACQRAAAYGTTPGESSMLRAGPLTIDSASTRCWSKIRNSSSDAYGVQAALGIGRAARAGCSRAINSWTRRWAPTCSSPTAPSTFMSPPSAESSARHNWLIHRSAASDTSSRNRAKPKNDKVTR